MDYLGLYTDDYSHYGVTGQQVRWVAWDSPAAGLSVGDVIVEIRCEGQVLTGAGVPRQSYPPGGASALWAALGFDTGAPAEVTIRRGAETLELALVPVAQTFYTTPDGKRSLFPDGPYALSRSEIGETWSTWYERIIKAWSLILCDGWRQRSFKTRELLARHADEHAAIAWLSEHHPGPFADSMAERWQDVKASLEGTRYPAEAIDLAWREAAAGRRESLKAAGAAAHAAYSERIADELTDAFPAPDPYETESGTVAGRVVMVDRVSPRNMRNDGVQAWYILGDRHKGWYFLDVHSPEVMRLWAAIEDYRRQVTLHLGESYRFYLRLTEDPMIRAKERRNVALGFKTQLVAAFVGNELFLEALDTDEPVVAGKALMAGAAMEPAAADAGPSELARQRVTAVKRLRRDRWEALFADWKVSADFSGEPIFLPYGDIGHSDKRSGWEQSRKRLFDDVLDVKVLGESAPYTVLAADPADGTPHVEECEVLVEHVGEFDGERRSFKDSWLTRAWRLQRVDGGPWRFVYPRAL